MRLAILAALSFAAFGPFSSAFAQDHPWCLMRASTHHCLYDTAEQCQSAKHGPTDFCEENHSHRHR